VEAEQEEEEDDDEEGETRRGQQGNCGCGYEDRRHSRRGRYL
jgi:hypothetical protein